MTMPNRPASGSCGEHGGARWGVWLTLPGQACKPPTLRACRAPLVKGAAGRPALPAGGG